MSELITDQVIAVIGAAVVTGLVTLIGMHLKFRREDAKERATQRQQDEEERARERQKRAEEGDMLREALEKITSIDLSVNNRDEPVTKQLDRIESQQTAMAERQAQHSREISGLRKDFNLMHADIGVLRQTDRRISEGLVEVREDQGMIHRIIDKITGSPGDPQK